MRHYAHLDGLRGLAVLGVLIQHTFGIARETAFSVWAPGPAGVRLFFVLSGFLITGILLDARARGEHAGAPRLSVLRAFYARRFLRIFPLYYAVLLVGGVIGIHAIRSQWPWFVTYTSNVLNAIDMQRVVGASHFWSLAVEEQFYLVWPWLILFTPARYLPSVLIGAIVVSGASRCLLIASGQSYAAYVLTLTRLDALAAGGLLAYVGIGGRLQHIAGSVGLVAFLGLVTLPSDWTIVIALSEWCGIAWAVWLVGRSAEGAFGRVLAWRPLMHLGTISYGVYVIHAFVPETLHIVQVWFDVWLRLPGHGLGRFLYVTSVTLVAAALSWRYVERPLNDLKRHVPYVRRRSEQEAVA